MPQAHDGHWQSIQNQHLQEIHTTHYYDPGYCQAELVAAYYCFKLMMATGIQHRANTCRVNLNDRCETQATATLLATQPAELATGTRHPLAVNSNPIPRPAVGFRAEPSP